MSNSRDFFPVESSNRQDFPLLYPTAELCGFKIEAHGLDMLLVASNYLTHRPSGEIPHNNLRIRTGGQQSGIGIECEALHGQIRRTILPNYLPPACIPHSDVRG